MARPYGLRCCIEKGDAEGDGDPEPEPEPEPGLPPRCGDSTLVAAATTRATAAALPPCCCCCCAEGDATGGVEGEAVPEQRGDVMG